MLYPKMNAHPMRVAAGEGHGRLSLAWPSWDTAGQDPVADVFVDRDGVINHNRSDHVKSWSEFEFLPGSVEALGRLTHAGHRTFVVTNQAVVNRGLVSSEVAASINQRMVEEVARQGGTIEAVLVCPHAPEEGCGCRKPRPGLLLQAREALGVVLEKAYVIGDFISDLEAAWAAGCTPILVLTGRGRQAYEAMPRERLQHCWVARDLLHAVELIGANGRQELGRSHREKDGPSQARRPPNREVALSPKTDTTSGPSSARRGRSQRPEGGRDTHLTGRRQR